MSTLGESDLQEGPNSDISLEIKDFEGSQGPKEEEPWDVIAVNPFWDHSEA